MRRQIFHAALIITDHDRATYYLAKFFVKHNSYKIEPFDFKKVNNEFFFKAREA